MTVSRPAGSGRIADARVSQRPGRLGTWRLELLDPTPRLAPQLAVDRSPANAPASLAMERRITQIRWVGAVLCALVAPFLGLDTHLPALYACLAIIAGYNIAFSRLAETGRPAWLVIPYTYGLFD